MDKKAQFRNKPVWKESIVIANRNTIVLSVFIRKLPEKVAIHLKLHFNKRPISNGNPYAYLFGTFCCRNY